MADYFEIDFLDVGLKKSGDAIPLRYEIGGSSRIHVVDGGFQETGEAIVNHIKKYYGNPSAIDYVVVTHGDNDHVGGLRTVMETFTVGELWMLRPWKYAQELLPRFAKFTSAAGLEKRLKEIYTGLAQLEQLAITKNIPIGEPFAGARIGAFAVLSPLKGRYLDLVVESEKTPLVAVTHQENISEVAKSFLDKLAEKAVAFVKSIWGQEAFPEEGTAPDNEMSVVQIAVLCGKRILLTGDAGRIALSDAADVAPHVGLTLPGIDRFQVPHHGSRRNVSSDLLDRWLGPKLTSMPAEGAETFSAITSAAKEDNDHPRKAVVRAIRHRGGNTLSTKGNGFYWFSGLPLRSGWTVAKSDPYPEDQEA
jgi:beta-lactamase superfamily II metal-dependent hydrolase